MSNQSEKTAKADKQKPESSKNVLKIREGLTVKELSDQMGVKAKDLVEVFSAGGLRIGVNDPIDSTLAQALAAAVEMDIELVSIEKEILGKLKADTEKLVVRPPVVTIMGHVDHGKTTLLDAFRKSNLVDKESGGITQHIGAYRVLHKGRPITFIDTPGHEAFTQLRARGANVTDIIILIIAADDGVMPQTKEAINHAKAANVPIIVAINKIDKPEADLDKVKQQLSQNGILIEEWGGDIVSVDISAKEKTNLDDLLEMILLVSEMAEIKANPEAQAHGVVLEARLDAKRGPLATVIIQHGVLKHGDAFIAGNTYGKVKALFDENRKPMKSAGPSMPAEILGFIDVPSAGDIFQVVGNIEAAKSISSFRMSQGKKEETDSRTPAMTLDQLFKEIEGERVKDLSLIVKADVQGSVEVLTDILPALSTDRVKIKITHAATGNITETDVLLASASESIIIGYNIKVNAKIRDLADEENVEIRQYDVIYQLTDDVKKAIVGMLEPTIKETALGKAQVRRIFRIPRVGIIAGCLVTDGKIIRNALIRILRDGEVIGEDRVSSLKHLKDNVNEVKKNYECGIGLEKFKDIQEGDIIEAYITEKIAAK